MISLLWQLFGLYLCLVNQIYDVYLTFKFFYDKLYNYYIISKKLLIISKVMYNRDMSNVTITNYLDNVYGMNGYIHLVLFNMVPKILIYMYIYFLFCLSLTIKTWTIQTLFIYWTLVLSYLPFPYSYSLPRFNFYPMLLLIHYNLLILK